MSRFVKQKAPSFILLKKWGFIFFVILGHLILLLEVQKQTEINL